MHSVSWHASLSPGLLSAHLGCIAEHAHPGQERALPPRGLPSAPLKRAWEPQVLCKPSVP